MDDLTPQEKKIVDGIVGKPLPSGKNVRPEDAIKALKSPAWKKWMDDWEKSQKGVVPIHGFNADGEPVMTEKYEDRTVLCWMYDNYLRMAQMDQRSQYTQTVDQKTGLVVNKKVIEMTFDEFLMDGLKNLDWVEKEDIPMKRKFYTASPIGVIYGISEEVAKFNLELVRRLRESIQKYMKLAEKDKLIYVTDAVLFE